MKKIIVMVAVLLAFCLTSYAHSGKTDSNGGHYNRSTGEYHYHHGYSAHQHPDGICPYSNKEKTNQVKFDDVPNTTSPKQTDPVTDKNDTYLIVFVAMFCGALFIIVNRKKKK